MNKIRIIFVFIVAAAISICLFSACKKDLPEPVTTTANQTTTKNNGYTYNENFSLEDEAETQYTHIAPPVPTRADKNENRKPAANESSAYNETTKKSASDTIDEKVNGLNILSKTSPVIKGNDVSIIVMGTPSTEYTIEFYETATDKAPYIGQETAKSDSSGIVSWNFKIKDTCETGERKIIIREKNSDKYIQTSITVL